MKRFQTKYPGVFFREIDRVGGPGKERCYYIVFKRDGKLFEEKVGKQYADDMTPARAAIIRAERIENKRKSRKEIREEQKTVKWTINRLWEQYKAVNSGKALQHEDGKFKKYVESTIGNKEPGELVALDVDRIRLDLQRQGKHTQAARVLELVRRTINFGVKRNLIPPVPFKISVPRLNNQVTEDLSPDQLQKLLKALDEDEDILAANAMRLALFTGMRRGEIFKLRWDDIDTERGFIHIRDPKGGPDQTIPLNEAARQLLARHPRDDQNPYVFPGNKPATHVREMRTSIDRIRKRAGLPEGFRPLHGLRHVFASMLASSGQVDMYTLQKLLTHKSPLMTQRYAHLRDEGLRRASNLAGEIVRDVLSADDRKDEKGAAEP